MEPKVSVIIPIYNVEKFIKRCLISLFGQTLFDGLELIFINDSTQDHSMSVLQEVLLSYPQHNDHIKIINHHYNRGIAAARTTGVENATGQYIIHCDPDDWIEPDMYAAMYDTAVMTKADIVICDFFVHSGDDIYVSKQSLKSNDNFSLLESISGASSYNIHGALWNKLIKKSCYAEAKFPPGVSFCEDVAVLFDILSKPISVSYMKKPLYHYQVDTSNSLAKTITSVTLASDLKLINHFVQTMKLPTANQRYRNCLASMIIWIIFNRAFKYSVLSDEEFRKTYSAYSKYLRFNRQLPKVIKILLRMAMQGKFKLSRSIFDFLNDIRKIF